MVKGEIPENYYGQARQLVQAGWKLVDKDKAIL